MFIPIILGSDKTTVSVVTGNNQYWPVYLSIGNIFNATRRAHRNGIVLLGFLPIPKSEFEIFNFQFLFLFNNESLIAGREHANDAHFRKFRRQLFHSCLSRMLQALKPGMTKPVVMRCPDGHFRRVIFGLATYIADYPEQALLSCTVQGWCAKSVNYPTLLLTLLTLNQMHSSTG
jgi:hypothetical protein